MRTATSDTSTPVAMDLKKATQAFRASLVADLHAAHEKDVAALQTEYDDKLANLTQQYETNMAGMEQSMDNPIEFMAKFFPDTPDHGTETAPAKKKRGRSSEIAAVPAIDGAGDDIHMPKRGRLSAAADTDQGTDGRSVQTVRRSEAGINDDDSIASDEPVNKPRAQARGQRPVDLQFATQLIINLRNPHLDAINHPFMQPVHAGKYPDYYRKIKHPMDLETMAVKLNTAKYKSADEVKKDFELMIQNCNDYNPVGDPTCECGIRLRRYFEDWWNGKGRWERQTMREMERESHFAEDEGKDKGYEKKQADDKEEDDEKEDGGATRLECLKPTGNPVIDARNRKLFENRLKQIRDEAIVRKGRDKAKLEAVVGKSEVAAAEDGGD